MDRAQALDAFAALAHADRLEVVRLLSPCGAEGLAAGAIARALGLSASRLSFHLAQLQQAGIVRSRRVARQVIYAVDPGTLGGAIGWLLHDCCRDSPEVAACCRQAGDR